MSNKTQTYRLAADLRDTCGDSHPMICAVPDRHGWQLQYVADMILAAEFAGLRLLPRPWDRA